MKRQNFFDSEKSSGGGYRLTKLLNKDIKELNGIILSLFCVSFLLIVGITSYKVNSSYAIFTDTIEGEKIIETTVYFPTLVEKVISKVGESGLEVITHEADSSLQIGGTGPITEYRFRGNNSIVTNNYVYFNCEDSINQTETTCELYRIIGVFPVDNGTGKIENRIKLIKVKPYNNTTYEWDTSGSNNWARPASLNTVLNTTYWNTIDEKYQALIGTAKYYLGGYNDAIKQKTSVMWNYERKNTGSTYYYGNNPTNWTGKIALLYASDYGYSANSACSENTNLFDYETNSCTNNNWLYYQISEWVLNQHSYSSKGGHYIYSGGHVNPFEVLGATHIYARPVFYLTPDAKIFGGNGSISNPYKLMS